MGSAKDQKHKMKYFTSDANLFLKEDVNYINSYYL